MIFISFSSSFDGWQIRSHTPNQVRMINSAAWATHLLLLYFQWTTHCYTMVLSAIIYSNPFQFYFWKKHTQLFYLHKLWLIFITKSGFLLLSKVIIYSNVSRKNNKVSSSSPFKLCQVAQQSMSTKPRSGQERLAAIYVNKIIVYGFFKK